WEGEGGGVLLNQCPHNLDLWQWICGMPKRMIAFANFGRLHNIEVEDEVTAYVEYENGASGVFVASTGESPGTNRFEIAGDRGRLLLEGGKLTFNRTTESVSEYCKTWCCDIPASMESNDHGDIMNDFVNAILTGEKLLAPGQEGVNSLQLSNAMMLSSWTNSWVDLPVDEDKFHTLLKEKIASSTYEKPEVERKVADVAGTF
ncbi:MAG: Gfo/Idh/MocA family protein, partial [Planctomycetota bacterium]